MLQEIINKKSAVDTLSLIEDARNAELCRDISSLRNILLKVWDDNNRLPDFAEYEPAIRAELLRLSGFFLTFYGRSRNLRDCQFQAKDLLTKAIDIFDSEGLVDKAAESKIILAFCYWNTGEISEAEAILALVENDFANNKLHPVYLQIQINRLLILTWNGEYDEAVNTINKISSSMAFCNDFRLRAMFHSEAGIIFRRTKSFESAVYHYQEALRLAKKSQNTRFIALNLNNLALLYRDVKDFKSSHESVDKSFKMYLDLGDKGWLPHVLDTKALIYIDENKFDEALKTIEDALAYFYQGEDYNGLTSALWTKIRCLLQLKRTEDAFITFVELERFASENIGEVAVRKFAKKLTEEVYVLRHLPLGEESAEFRKSRVSKALREANGTIGLAAKILGLNSHQALSDILNNQFPGLLQELGFKRRARRGTAGKHMRPEAAGSDISPGEREITRLVLPGNNFSFNFNVPSEKFETFYFDKSSMKNFGVNSASIVAVVPISELKAGQYVVVCDGDVFSVAKTEYNEWSGVYFISDGKGEPLPLDEKNIVGEPIGYCLFSKTNEKLIEFSRLES